MPSRSQSATSESRKRHERSFDRRHSARDGHKSSVRRRTPSVARIVRRLTAANRTSSSNPNGTSRRIPSTPPINGKSTKKDLSSGSGNPTSNRSSIGARLSVTSSEKTSQIGTATSNGVACTGKPSFTVPPVLTRHSKKTSPSAKTSAYKTYGSSTKEVETEEQKITDPYEELQKAANEEIKIRENSEFLNRTKFIPPTQAAVCSRGNNARNNTMSPIPLSPVGACNNAMSPKPLSPVGACNNAMSPKPLSPVVTCNNAMSPKPLSPVGACNNTMTPKPLSPVGTCNNAMTPAPLSPVVTCIRETCGTRLSPSFTNGTDREKCIGPSISPDSSAVTYSACGKSENTGHSTFRKSSASSPKCDSTAQSEEASCTDCSIKDCKKGAVCAPVGAVCAPVRNSGRISPSPSRKSVKNRPRSKSRLNVRKDPKSSNEQNNTRKDLKSSNEQNNTRKDLKSSNEQNNTPDLQDEDDEDEDESGMPQAVRPQEAPTGEPESNQEIVKRLHRNRMEFIARSVEPAGLVQHLAEAGYFRSDYSNHARTNMDNHNLKFGMKKGIERLYLWLSLYNPNEDGPASSKQ